MKSRYCCVVDSKNMYRFAAIVLTTQTPDGTEQDIVKDYTLQDGEVLVEAVPPNMVKARWTGTKWEETATPEEIAAHRAAHRAAQQALFN